LLWWFGLSRCCEVDATFSRRTRAGGRAVAARGTKSAEGGKRGSMDCMSSSSQPGKVDSTLRVQKRTSGKCVGKIEDWDGSLGEKSDTD
jgi:hypothetical protein